MNPVFETLAEELGLAVATRVRALLKELHGIDLEQARRRDDKRETFERLRADGWPNGTTARSKREMARRCGIDKHTLDRWIKNSGASPRG